MNIQTKTIQLGQINVSYLEYIGFDEVKNNVIPWIFLHGWGGSAASWGPLWQQLIEQNLHLHLVALDFPGFGHSPIPLSPWSVGDYANKVIDFLGALKINRANFVVHSFGGRVGLKIAAQHPARINKIAFLAPAGLTMHPARTSLIKKITRIGKKLFTLPILGYFFKNMRNFWYKLIGSTDYLNANHPVMRLTLQKVIAEDLTPLLASITAPTLIFWGKNDSYVPVADGYKMKGQISGAQLVILVDGRHGIHKTHAAQISQKLLNFFKQ